LNQDIELRIRLAEYFAFVSVEKFRSGWVEYHDALVKHRDEIRSQINSLEAEWEAEQIASSGRQNPEINRIERNLAWLYKEVGYVERNRSVAGNPRAPDAAALPPYAPSPVYGIPRTRFQCQLKLADTASTFEKFYLVKQAVRQLTVNIHTGFLWAGPVSVATPSPSGMKDAEDITVPGPYILAISSGSGSPNVVFSIPLDDNLSAVTQALVPVVKDPDCLRPGNSASLPAPPN
jgi:hypothetical protein